MLEGVGEKGIAAEIAPRDAGIAQQAADQIGMVDGDQSLEVPFDKAVCVGLRNVAW